jgi:hypothetical protein
LAISLVRLSIQCYVSESFRNVNFQNVDVKCRLYLTPSWKPPAGHSWKVCSGVIRAPTLISNIDTLIRTVWKSTFWWSEILQSTFWRSTIDTYWQENDILKCYHHRGCQLRRAGCQGSRDPDGGWKGCSSGQAQARRHHQDSDPYQGEQGVQGTLRINLISLINLDFSFNWSN